VRVLLGGNAIARPRCLGASGPEAHTAIGGACAYGVAVAFPGLLS
jgi:hypothetical protein